MKNHSSKKNISQIAKKHKSAINDICKKHKLKFLVIFGSQLTELTHEKSDLDIAYLSHKKLTIDEIDDIFANLSMIFKKNIDMVDMHDAGYILLMQIFKNYFILYEEEKGKFIDSMSRAYINYIDFKKYYDQINNINIQSLNTLQND